MTCIIGLKTNNKVYMGSDSAITIYRGQLAETGNKIRNYGDCLVGFSGAKAVQNILEEISHIFDGNFDAKHLNKIWRSLADATPTNSESELLIACGSQLYWMGNIASWRIVEEEFETIGSGSQVARGAMQMAADFIANPSDRILESLLISQQYCIGVKEPFHIEHT